MTPPPPPPLPHRRRRAVSMRCRRCCVGMRALRNCCRLRRSCHHVRLPPLPPLSPPPPAQTDEVGREQCAARGRNGTRTGVGLAAGDEEDDTYAHLSNTSHKRGFSLLCHSRTIPVYYHMHLYQHLGHMFKSGGRYGLESAPWITYKYNNGYWHFLFDHIDSSDDTKNRNCSNVFRFYLFCRVDVTRDGYINSRTSSTSRHYLCNPLVCPHCCHNTVCDIYANRYSLADLNRGYGDDILFQHNLFGGSLYVRCDQDKLTDDGISMGFGINHWYFVCSGGLDPLEEHDHHEEGCVDDGRQSLHGFPNHRPLIGRRPGRTSEHEQHDEFVPEHRGRVPAVTVHVAAGHHLLHLRGGGPTIWGGSSSSTFSPPRGAGVRDWLEESEDELPYDDPVSTSRDGHEIVVGGSRVAEPSSPSDVLYRHGDSDTQVRDEQLDYWGWLERELTSPWGTAAPPPSTDAQPALAGISPSSRQAWTITGSRNGIDVEVCMQCCLDRPLGGTQWARCQAGHKRCSECASQACRACGDVIGPSSLLSTAARHDTVECATCASSVPLRVHSVARCVCRMVRCIRCANSTCPRCGTRATVQISLHSALRIADTVAACGEALSAVHAAESKPIEECAYDTFDRSRLPAVDSVAQEDLLVLGATRPDPPSIMECISCGCQSLTAWCTWRICRCRATLCSQCARQPCRACGTTLACAALDTDEFPSSEVHGGFSGEVGDERDVIGRLDGHECDTGSESSCGIRDDPIDKVGMQNTLVLTPAEVVVRRDRMLADARQALNERRSKSRTLAREQVRQGLRPPRQRGRREGIVVVQANVTHGSTWADEMAFGSTFTQCDFAAIQEHRLQDEQRDMAARRITREGWDSIVDEAYTKTTLPGGGTALLAARWSGVRPVGDLAGEAAEALTRLRGRVSLGIIDLVGSALFASFYGLDGLSVAKQVPLWLDLGLIARFFGLPFIFLGDWQVLPSEMIASGWPSVMGATVVAPSLPTNLISRRTIDDVVMSSRLADLVTSVDVVVDARFSPHAPVRMEMRAPPSLGLLSRLVRPRLLPAQKPPDRSKLSGTAIEIDWSGWLQNLPNIDDVRFDDDLTSIDASLDQWYACANAELCSMFGMTGEEAEAHHTGIGVAPRTVAAPAGLRRRGTADEAGQLGHRLAWASKAVHLALSWYPLASAVNLLPRDARELAPAIRLLRAFPPRARAFLQEQVVRNPSDVDDQEVRVLKDALECIVSMLYPPTHDQGIPPLDRWAAAGGMDQTWRTALLTQEADLAAASARLLARRRRLHTRALRIWARGASTKEAHAATRSPEAATAYSASASKAHRGERTAQLAADRGMDEWTTQWDALPGDTGDDIPEMVRRISADGPLSWFTPDDGIAPALALPPITEHRVERIARRIRGTSGVSHDALRLRQIAWLSTGAKRALAHLLMWIEALMKWPTAARGALAIALSKKSGGSRLIGIIVALYRLWSKLRYADLQEALEARLSRPFLAAAPGRGAARAAATASLLAEAAWARGEAAATTSADIAKFYEQISYEELAHGALAFGIPPSIVALALHQYAGPRRLRVAEAVSRPAFPRRSVIPGCTWATVLIRAIIIGPAERFLAAVTQRRAGFDVDINFSVYIDDLVLTTRGFAREVALLHSWCSRLLIQWVTQRLRKRLAPDKLLCIVSSPSLRCALARAMRELGCKIAHEGDMLGADYSAGGRLRRRAGMNKRFTKNKKRGGRLRWFRRLGGRACEVARGGTGPSLAFGATAAGLPPRAQHLRRRLQAAASAISASGSSLTGKLAVGGDSYAESDPSVLDPNPPLLMLLALLWDSPRLRGEFIDTWRQLSSELAGLSPMRTWSEVRGITSAAWAHLRQVGGGNGQPLSAFGSLTPTWMSSPCPLPVLVPFSGLTRGDISIANLCSASHCFMPLMATYSPFWKRIVKESIGKQ